MWPKKECTQDNPKSHSALEVNRQKQVLRPHPLSKTVLSCIVYCLYIHVLVVSARIQQRRHLGGIKNVFKPRIELGTSSVLDWRDNQLHYLNTESQSPIFVYINSARCCSSGYRRPHAEAIG